MIIMIESENQCTENFPSQREDISTGRKTMAFVHSEKGIDSYIGCGMYE